VGTHQRLTVNLIGDYTQSRVTNGGDFFTFVKASAAGAGGGRARQCLGHLASCGITAAEGNRNFCTSPTTSTTPTAAAPRCRSTIRRSLHHHLDQRLSQEPGIGQRAATSVFRADPLLLQVANGDVHRPIDLFTQELRISSPSGQTVEYTGGLFFSNQIQSRTPEPLTVAIHPRPACRFPWLGHGRLPRHRHVDGDLWPVHHPCQRQAAPDRGRALHQDGLKLDTFAGNPRFAQQPHRAGCEPLLVEGGRAI
jgi:iron complex outermembrane receptor protein